MQFRSKISKLKFWIKCISNSCIHTNGSPSVFAMRQTGGELFEIRDRIMSYSNFYPASNLFHGSQAVVMGTRLDVLLIGEDPTLSSAIWEEIKDVAKDLDGQLNRFNPDSEVFKVNKEALHHPVHISERLFHILANCCRYAELTEDCFDITQIDINRLSLSENDRSVSFQSEISIDLGGYAKGYALSEIEQILTRHAIRNALVNFGNSSVLAVGSHPYGSCWEIGIDNPYNRESVGIVRLRDNSLSISGNMPSHPCHIKNPFTGDYVQDRKLVSVTAPDAVDAEVLSTALMVAPEDRIENIVSKFNISEKQIYSL